MSLLDELFDRYNCSKILDYKVLDSKLSLWPLVRYQVLSERLFDKYNTANPWDRKRKVNFRNSLSYVVRTLIRCPFFNRKSFFLFVSSSISNIYFDGFYFNKRVEHFFKYLDKSYSLIEDSNNYFYYSPRKSEFVYSHDFIRIISNLFYRFIYISKLDKQTIMHFVDYLYVSSLVTSSADADRYFKLVMKLVREYRIRFFLYHILLKKIGTRVIFLECASYGYQNVSLIRACRKLSIRIIEFQHGFVSKNHPAYNFHRNFDKSYLDYLPDMFLSFGEFWTNRFNLPVQIIGIGNPHLEEMSQRLYSHNKENLIVYASNGFEPELVKRHIFELHYLLASTSFQLYFRPHPGERHRLSGIYKDFKQLGVFVDVDDLYVTLKKAKYIISDFSTVLYEATAFDCCPLLLETIQSDNNIEQNEFLVLKSLNTILDYLSLDPNNLICNSNFWKKDWSRNFKSFISSVD